jgi:hypothetical protein
MFPFSVQKVGRAYVILSLRKKSQLVDHARNIRKQGLMTMTSCIRLRQRNNGGSLYIQQRTFGCINNREFPNCLSNYYFLKNNSFPCCYLVNIRCLYLIQIVYHRADTYTIFATKQREFLITYLTLCILVL